MDLGLSRKRSSRESYEVLLASSIQKEQWFWSESLPIGILGVDSFKLINVDETGVYLKSVATKYGRSHTTTRVRHPVHYTRNEPKVNVILAVDARESPPSS